MLDTFIGPVIGIDKHTSPAYRHLLVVERIAMVLRCDVAESSVDMEGRLVVTTVAKWQLVHVESSRHAEQQVAHADAKDGLVEMVDGRLEMIHRLCACPGLPGPLEMKRPSNWSATRLKSKSKGKTVTLAPRWVRQRRMFCLTPQSITAILTSPVGL